MVDAADRAEIVDVLNEFADRLEAKDIDYKPRAYRQAAESVADAPSVLLRNPREIDNVGDTIAEKIESYLQEGKIDELEQLREETPTEINEVTAVEGVGPKRAGKLYRAIDVENLDDLERAAKHNRVRNVSGFGPKTEEKIKEGIHYARQKRQSTILEKALDVAREIEREVSSLKAIEKAAVSGELRRRRESVETIEIVAATTTDPDTDSIGTDPSQRDTNHSLNDFTETREVNQFVNEVAQNRYVTEPIETERDTDTAVEFGLSGIDADLTIHLCRPRNYTSERWKTTGNDEHVEEVRKKIRDREKDDGREKERTNIRKTNIQEEGGGKKETGFRDGVEGEREIYVRAGMDYVAPEIREGWGEVEAAADGELPNLVEKSDIKGDLHTHTHMSDGGNSVREMAEAGERQGYSYLALTDHTYGLSVVDGLDGEELLEYSDEIERVNQETEIELFSGAEANITDDGIDISSETAKKLDVVVASVHWGMNMDREEATKRLVSAISTEGVDILGHPSGRLINSREGYSYDFDRILEAAREYGVALELNSNPRRLDITDQQVRKATEAEVPVAINTDAHSIGNLDYIEYGVHTARRGWSEKPDILNTKTLNDMERWLTA